MNAIIAANPAVPKFKVPSSDCLAPEADSVVNDPSTAVGESLLIPEVENAAEADGAKPPETTPSATHSAATKFLDALWRSDRINQLGTLDRQIKKFRNFHVKDVAVAVSRALALSAEGADAYFACADYLSPNSLIAANAYGAWSFWADIDCGADKAAAGKGYATIEEARQALTQFCADAGLPEPTHIVSSGGGLHVYWVLDKFVPKELWQAYATKFKALTHALNFLADDSRTADIASVLRVPGTLNYKYDPPRPVALLHASDMFIGQATFFAAIDLAHERLCPIILKVATPDTVNASANQSSHKGMSSSGGRVFTNAEISALLKQIDPDIEYGDWTKVGMAVHHVTGGSDEGLAIFDEWSGRGAKYKGTGEIRNKWRSLKSDRENCYNIGTIINMVKAKGIDWKAACAEAEDPFELFETTVVFGGQKSLASPNTVSQGAVVAEVVETGTGTTDAIKVAKAAEAESKLVQSAALAAMQTQFALINLNGKFGGFDQIGLATLDEKGKAQPLTVSNRIDTNLMVERTLYAKFPQAKAKIILDEFWVSPQTQCYTGVDFDPTGTSGNKLNLWVGPTIIPKAGGWKLISTFLLMVICGGDEKHYQYLVCYIAHALQRPGEKPGVMIILLGGQGIGKGTLARILHIIWGATFYQVGQADAITGNFNAILERTFIIFMDEALFAGDHKASDTLKSLVTEPVIHINEKYQPARQTASFHRFFVGSNADHLKATDRDDRRDFTLRVSEAHRNDHEYWNALYAEISGGGVAAMVHDLLAMDLSGFNVRAKPNTKELLQQKILSLKDIPRWWYDSLYSGDLSIDGDWPDFIATEEAIEDVWKMCGGRGYKKPNGNDIADALLKMCPSASKAQTKSDGLTRKRGYSLPPLDQARAEFDKYIGGAVVWPVETSGDKAESL